MPSPDARPRAAAPPDMVAGVLAALASAPGADAAIAAFIATGGRSQKPTVAAATAAIAAGGEAALAIVLPSIRAVGTTRGFFPGDGMPGNTGLIAAMHAIAPDAVVETGLAVLARGRWREDSVAWWCGLLHVGGIDAKRMTTWGLSKVMADGHFRESNPGIAPPPGIIVGLAGAIAALPDAAVRPVLDAWRTSTGMDVPAIAGAMAPDSPEHMRAMARMSCR